MSKDFQRAQALLRLATDPATGEGEARTAALLCCKLICIHGFLSEGPGLPAAGAAGRVPVGAWARYWSASASSAEGLDGILENLSEMLREVARQQSRPPAPRPAPTPKTRAKSRGVHPPAPAPDPRDFSRRAEALYQQLRFRAPGQPEDVLRRAANSAVYEEMLKEGAGAGAPAGARRP